MTRRYTKKQRRQSNELLFIAAIAFIAVSGAIGAQFLDVVVNNIFFVFAIILAVMGAVILVAAKKWRAKAIKRLKGQASLEVVDQMTGVEFEGFLQGVLISRGYKVQDTPRNGDLGVDIIASKNGQRIAIQAKRYSYKVDRRAVSDAVAGMKHYKCDKAMVITSNYFQPGAKTLAKSNTCELVDRDLLAEWLAEFQKS